MNWLNHKIYPVPVQSPDALQLAYGLHTIVTLVIVSLMASYC